VIFDMAFKTCVTKGMNWMIPQSIGAMGNRCGVDDCGRLMAGAVGGVLD